MPMTEMRLLLVRCPDTLEEQRRILLDQAALLALLGEESAPVYVAISTDTDDIGPHVRVEMDLEELRGWLAEHELTLLSDDDAYIVIMARDVDVSVQLAARPYLTVRGGVGSREAWGELLEESVKLWGPRSAAVGEGDVLLGDNLVAGWMNYTTVAPDLPPELASVGEFGDGWLVTAKSGQEDALVETLARQLDPSRAQPQRVDDPATRYRREAGAPPISPTGEVLRLHIGEAAFDGYQERGGVPFYLHVEYVGDDAELTPERLSAAEATARTELAAARRVQPAAVVEWHTNSEAAAEALRERLAPVGVYVFWTPMEEA